MHDLFAILSDGEFHSGEEIGRRLGITRAAVWKQIQRLREESGQEVESQRGKGYRLPNAVEMLDPDYLGKELAGVLPLHVLQTIDSTNEEAKRLLRKTGKPCLVVAEQQTSGRGRRGRHWHSPYAANLYFSLVWPVVAGMRQLEGLSLAVGLSVQGTLTRLGLTDSGVKWPNDVLVQDRKISGILLEVVGDPTDRSHVVIGVGINVNMVAEQLAIKQSWTSLALELGRTLSRNTLLVELICDLSDALQVQLADGFPAIREAWQAASLWQGRKVVLQAGENRIEGTVVGVTDTAELALDDGTGKITCYAGGELTLRLRDDS